MRNAVKATVDAYDGTVHALRVGRGGPDPQGVEGGLPRRRRAARTTISDELLEHLRYPEDLFKVQRYQFARYHVTDAGDWYEGNDRWEVPEDPTAQRPPAAAVPALHRHRCRATTWSLTSVYVPRDKENNLASFVSVNSDATDRRLRQDHGAASCPTSPRAGPLQIANEFATDEDVARRCCPTQTGDAEPMLGNLLTLPVGDGLMYVAAGLRACAPARRRASRSCGSCSSRTRAEVGIGTTLSEAIEDALQSSRSAAPGGRPATPTETPSTSESPVHPPTESPSATPDTPVTGRHAGPDPRPAPPGRGEVRRRRRGAGGWQHGQVGPPDGGGSRAHRARPWHSPAESSTRSRGLHPDLGARDVDCNVLFTDAGWSSSVARWAHNPEVAGSNPAPATK